MVAWMCKGNRADPLDFEVGEVDHDPQTLNPNLSIQQGEGFPFSVYEGRYVFFIWPLCPKAGTIALFRGLLGS